MHAMKTLLPALAVVAAATGRCAVCLAQTAAAPAADATLYAPSYVPWVHTVILAIAWLFIAAILLGPVVMYFEREPAPPTRRRATR